VVRQNHGHPHGVKTGIFPLEIGTKNQNFLENLISAASYPLIDFFLALSLFADMTLTLHKVHGSGAMQ